MTIVKRDRVLGQPSFEATTNLVPHEVPNHPEIAAMVNGNHQTQYKTLRSYVLGECTMLMTREFGQYHLSIAHPKRYPTWLEISTAWYRIVPGAESKVAALMLPKLSEYINIHNFCMQVHEAEPTALRDRDPEEPS